EPQRRWRRGEGELEAMPGGAGAAIGGGEDEAMEGAADVLAAPDGEGGRRAEQARRIELRSAGRLHQFDLRRPRLVQRLVDDRAAHAQIVLPAGGAGPR